jgi:hypothetical protein
MDLYHERLELKPNKANTSSLYCIVHLHLSWNLKNIKISVFGRFGHNVQNIPGKSGDILTNMVKHYG